MNEVKKSEVPEKNDQAHKLDAIKEIIFGDQIKEYASEFKEIKELIRIQREELLQDIQSMRNDLEDLMFQSKLDVEKAIEKFENETSEKLSAMEQGKTNRTALADMLEDLAHKLRA